MQKVVEHLPGHLVLGEFFECASLPDDVRVMENLMLKAAERMSATVVVPVFHKFNPQGVSGVVIIQESHLAIHTWPEIKYAAIDLFSCGQISYKSGFDFLAESFGAASVKIKVIKRGR